MDYVFLFLFIDQWFSTLFYSKAFHCPTQFSSFLISFMLFIVCIKTHLLTPSMITILAWYGHQSHGMFILIHLGRILIGYQCFIIHLLGKKKM